jgi:ABC-2 type transport system ATP-binding protein
MEAILTARGLEKRFGAFTSLAGVDLDLGRGEVVGFLGPNGAGKSTTMKILTGFLSPSAGTATIAGHDLQRDPLACRRAIGYLPEEVPLYLDMTVTAYLDHVARLKGVPRAQRRREVVDAIEAAWLQENARRHIRKLSKGNRQRVGLAQALIARPPILILDEPTSGLDPAQVANFRDLVARLSERHSILLSTHILAEVEATCRRVVIINRGRTVLSESIEALRARTKDVTRLRVRLRAGRGRELADRLRTQAWATVLEAGSDTVLLEAPESRRGEVVSAAESCGGLRELVEETRSLEECFRELVAATPAAG